MSDPRRTLNDIREIVSGLRNSLAGLVYAEFFSSFEYAIRKEVPARVQIVIAYTPDQWTVKADINTRPYKPPVGQGKSPADAMIDFLDKLDQLYTRARRRKRQKPMK